MTVLTLARRDLAAQKAVWVVPALALAASVLVPWANGQTLAAHAGLVGLAQFVGIVLVLSLVLGAAGIPADLGARRLGFYLTLPVSTGALLAGRLLGAWILALGCGALTLAPALLTGILGVREAAGLLGTAAVAAAVLVLAGHLLGVIWRSRSAWVVLDLTVLALGGLGLKALGRALVQDLPLHRVGDALAALAGVTAPILAATLVLAAWLHLERGRSDLRSGRKVLSLTLAAGIAAALLAGAGLLAYARGGGPSSLRQVVTRTAAQGPWELLYGQGRFGRPVAFLHDRATGRYHALAHGGVFTADGTHLVGCDGEGQRILDTALGTGRPVTRDRQPMPDRRGYVAAASTGGRRVAFVQPGKLTVLDLDTGAVLGEAVLTWDDGNARYTFTDDRTIRQTWNPLAHREARDILVLR